MKTMKFIIAIACFVVLSCSGMAHGVESRKLFSVHQNGKYGYIDRTGKLAIPLKFDTAGEFSEGLADVEIKGKRGFIDKSGKMVIAPKPYSIATDFSGGLASAITEDDEEVYFDKTGKYVWRESRASQ